MSSIKQFVILGTGDTSKSNFDLMVKDLPHVYYQNFKL